MAKNALFDDAIFDPLIFDTTITIGPTVTGTVHGHVYHAPPLAPRYLLHSLDLEELLVLGRRRPALLALLAAVADEEFYEYVPHERRLSGKSDAPGPR